MMSPNLILVGGGARSGKSAHALRLALAAGPARTFVATAQAFDDEMARRIRDHQRERGADFQTVESPQDLVGPILACGDQDVVLIDCVTLWLSNRLLAGQAPTEILQALDATLSAVGRCRAQCIFVSNEVGMGIVPDSPLGRTFRDLAGHANQRLSAAAGTVYFAAMGLILRLRPTPLAVVEPPLEDAVRANGPTEGGQPR